MVSIPLREDTLSNAREDGDIKESQRKNVSIPLREDTLSNP